MHWLDWLVLALFLATVVFDGWRHGRRTENLEEYFLAGRSARWWAVGLSIMATQASAITLISITGHGYEHGLHWVQVYFALPFAVVILLGTVVPWLQGARVFTAYEYLERRFNRSTRLLASALFLISRGLAVGTVLYAPSVVLSVVFGLQEWQSILAMGGLCVVYTSWSGLRGVIATDVKQMSVMFLGIAASLVVVLRGLPDGLGLGETFELAGAARRLEAVRLGSSVREILAEKYNLVAALCGGLFLFLGYFGADQSQVQRYLANRSLADSRRSLLMTAFLKVPLQFVILLVGVLIFVHYVYRPAPVLFQEPRLEAPGREARHAELWAERRAAADAFVAARRRGDPGTAEAAALRGTDAELRAFRDEVADWLGEETGGPGAALRTDSDFVYPYFLLERMPVGLLGLVVAGIFAAAMSSLDSALNSLATATVMDFLHPRGREGPPPRRMLALSRAVTLFWGLFATATAFVVGRLGPVIEVVNLIGSMFYGSLFGVFVLGRVVPAARGAVGWLSLLGGFAGVLFVHFFVNAETVIVNGEPRPPIGFLWYNLIGFAGVMALGVALGPGRRLLGLSAPPARG